MIGLLINIIFALLFAINSEENSINSLVVGYILGFGMIFTASYLFLGKKYLAKYFGSIQFLALFFVQFIKANIEVAILILFVSKYKIRSGFVDYSIEDLTLNEALILSHCITLTPGTISAKFNWDQKIIQIHVLDFSDSETIQKELDQKIKRAIWKFSR